MNGENSPGICVIKMLFNEVRYFSPKKEVFYTLKLKNVSNSVKKKWHGSLIHLGGGTLVVQLLKKNKYFYVCLP